MYVYLLQISRKARFVFLDDLLRVVIDIYKQAGDRLPSSGEVEICNNDTSLEKV